MLDALTDSDDQLFERWRAGEESAGKALLSRNLESLYRFFSLKVGPDVDDLIQETFIALVEGLDSFRRDASFRTYLFAIARRRLLRRWRWQRRHSDRFDTLQISLADMGTSPSAVAAKNETRDHVLEAMRQIPIDLQITLELYYWENLQTSEIAVVQGIPEGTARGRLRRARIALRTKLAEMGHHDDSSDEQTVERAVRRGSTHVPTGGALDDVR